MMFDNKYLVIFLILSAILSVGVVSATDLSDDVCSCIMDNNTTDVDENLNFFGWTLVMFKGSFNTFAWADTYVEIYDKDDGELLGEGYTDQYGDIWIDAGVFGSHNCEAFFYDDNDHLIGFKYFYIKACVDSVTVVVPER